jgi:hypothetical protein
MFLPSLKRSRWVYPAEAWAFGRHQVGCEASHYLSENRVSPFLKMLPIFIFD